MTDPSDATIPPVLNEPIELSSWSEVADVCDDLAARDWVFRGHDSVDWLLETSLEREFRGRASSVEQQLLWRFVRFAPRWLPSHLVPHDTDAAAWLGIVQHYGGPTRLLDVTRSPYVALFFAFESSTPQDRALWAIDHWWCAAAAAKIMAGLEGKSIDELIGRTIAAQAQLVYSLVHRQPHTDRLFLNFKPFTGVFPVDPWKPDARQSAQQAMFMCAANLEVSFMENLSANPRSTPEPVLKRFVLKATLREEILRRLAMMNVTAATLFPDLSGIARSLRTLPVKPLPAYVGR